MTALRELSQAGTMDTARVLVWLLLAVHTVLAGWALVGFAEWFAATVPWPRVSNELFPRHVLLAQWVLILAAAVVFLGGYAVRWRHTPVALAAVYAAMAAVCALQTFNYMTNDFRFAAMALEYTAYIGILIFLFRSDVFRPAGARRLEAALSQP
jgi:hypothetical protein